MQMLNFSEIQALPAHEQLVAFACAYMDSAERLCSGLSAGAEKASYAHGAVVMSLAFHSLELLFKGGILKHNPQEQFAGKSGHDLDLLSKRFFKLYPKKEFQFEVPFRREFSQTVGGMEAQEIAALKAYVEEHNKRVPEDQRHRYPTGIDGRTWEGAFGFVPAMFDDTLRGLQEVYARICPLLNAR